MIEIHAESGDDDEFLSPVRELVHRILAQHAPPEMVLTKLDNWFGPKWTGFSGEVHGTLGVWKERPTIPPFNPARVVWQRRFVAPSYAEVDAGAPLHQEISSAEATRRWAAVAEREDALLWFSGNSAAVGRGAFMAYLPASESYWMWYAGWARGECWKPVVLRGLSREELLSYLDGWPGGRGRTGRDAEGCRVATVPSAGRCWRRCAKARKVGGECWCRVLQVHGHVSC